MPGANYAFPECTISRTAKYQIIGTFQIPIRGDDFLVNWRNNIAAVREFSENVLEKFTYGVPF